MHKKLFVLSLVLALSVLIFQTKFEVTSAEAPVLDLPDQAGVYDVHGHPELKLRVFVHGGRPENFAKTSGAGKPTPPPPTELCVSSAVGDPDSVAVVHGAGWKLPATWEYRLNSTSVPASVGSANMVTIASNAFGDWASLVQSTVTISRGSDTLTDRAQLDGQNIVTWGRTSGTALATSYIWYNQTTGIAAEVDTIMNKKFSWYWSNPSTWPVGEVCAYQGVYDAENILTHELGHTIGLDDEYTTEYRDNTMYGYGATSETKKDSLTAGDKSGVNNLY